MRNLNFLKVLIQCLIFKIISCTSEKSMKHCLLIFFHIYIYMNRINNRLVFKIKDGLNLELKTPESMKLFLAQKR